MKNKKTQHKTVNGIPTSPLKFLLFVSKPYKKWAFLAMVMVVIASILTRSQAYILKKIIDTISETDPLIGGASVVLFWIMLYPTIGFIYSIIWRSSGIFGSWWGLGVESYGYKKLFNYLSRHSQQYFEDRFAGSLVSSISIATSSAESITSSFLWTYLSAGISFIVSVVYISYRSLTLGSIFVAWAIIMVTLNYFMVKRRRVAAMEESESQTELRGKTVDVANNISAARYFSSIHKENDFISGLVKTYKNKMQKSWYISESILLVNSFLVSIFVFTISFILYKGWLSGTMTVGDFVLTFTLAAALVDSLFFIGMSMNGFAKNFGEIESSLKELIIEHDIVDVPDAKNIIVKNGDIEIKDLDFGYDDTKKVFNKLHIKIPSGQRVGIVGPSGSGKTTFIKLLLRQYDVQGGGIYIDNQNISEVTQDSLYSNISIVPQEPMLFHRTIRENIMYGSPDATEEEMVESAKQAQAHDFILDLQKGYETLVGERGVKLSAGQRQRVAIARALLKNAPILILDEATSALDSESEVLIQKALEALMEGKTVLAVAHRLSTLAKMNRILVIKNGEIIEDGSHGELIKENGLYAKLWDHQAGGFIIDEE